MEGFLWQDWTTITVPASPGALTQGRHEWIDCSEVRDVVFWTECEFITGAGSLVMQTAPVAEEAMFMNLASLGSLTSGSVTITPALSQNAANPPSRWVRWKLTTGSGFTLTFRIHAAVLRR